VIKFTWLNASHPYFNVSLTVHHDVNQLLWPTWYTYVWGGWCNIHITE
jgi:hypothetical protein